MAFRAFLILSDFFHVNGGGTTFVGNSISCCDLVNCSNRNSLMMPHAVNVHRTLVFFSTSPMVD